MLANKATLKLDGTFLAGLMAIPDMGSEPEKVEVTCLTDEVKKYEFGIGDPGDMAFEFQYDNSSEETAYRKLNALAKNRGIGNFELAFADGTKFEFTGYVNVKINGAGVNGHVTFTATVGLQSDIEVTDPS